MRDKNLTFVFILHNMTKTVSMEYFKGIYRACNDFNINIFVEGIGAHQYNERERYNIKSSITSLINKKNFDGLIVWGSVLESVFFKDKKKLINFLNKYKNIPIVNIGLPLFDYPTVLTDNINGERKILEHLIKKHNYKYIGFLRGPATHYSDIERLNTFVDVIKEYNLPFNEKMISPSGEFTRENAISTTNYFINLIKSKELILGKNLDAIVASNDYFALQLIEELKKEGIRVPDDIAVTGFDNVIESKFSDPPITTVETNLSNIGYNAVKVLKEMIIDGKEFDKKIYIPSTLVLRNSCGCKDEDYLIDIPSMSVKNEKDFSHYIDIILKKNLDKNLTNFNLSNNAKIDKMNLFNLIDVLKTSIKENKSELFLKSLYEFINSKDIEYETILSYKKIFSLLDKFFCLDSIFSSLKKQIKQIFFEADKILMLGINRSLSKNTTNFTTYANNIININMHISNSFDTENALKNLELILKDLNIKDCIIFVFNEIGNYKKGLYPLFLYKNFQRFTLFNNDLKVEDALAIIKNKNENSILLFDTLSFRDTALGYVLFNIKAVDINYIGNTYGILTSAISSSYYGSTILSEVKRAEKERENFLKILANQNDELKKAIEIANKTNEAKSNFLTQVSHELKTPLSVIIGLSEKIQMVENRDEQNRYSNLIINEAKKVAELINNLLDISKIQAGKISLKSEPFDIKKLIYSIKETYQVIAEKKGLTLNIKIDEAIPKKIIGDEMRLRQIIINLVSNAIKFTEKGGVLISVDLLQKDSNIIKLFFQIKDSGIGIPKEKIPYIFEKFTQLENSSKIYEGSGLGATIAKQLVDLMNGKISVESKVGEGSNFSFILTFDIVNSLTTKKTSNIF